LKLANALQHVVEIAHIELNEIYETIYEVHGKVRVGRYIDKALLWINLPEYRNYPTAW
jgi:hypothetical protein